MPADNLDMAFKKELIRALSQLEGNWGNAEAAAVINPLLKGAHTPCFMIDSGMMEDIGFYTHRQIYISMQKKMSSIDTKDYVISFLTQPNLISDDVIPYLQLLDMILLYQRGEETQSKPIIDGLKMVIGRLTYEEKKLLTQLARKYPAAVRALLGLLLAGLNQITLSVKALQTLNPATLNRYKKEYMGSSRHS